MSRYASLQAVTEDTSLFRERVIDRLTQFETILEKVKTECNEKISALRKVMEQNIGCQSGRTTVDSGCQRNVFDFFVKKTSRDGLFNVIKSSKGGTVRRKRRFNGTRRKKIKLIIYRYE